MAKSHNNIDTSNYGRSNRHLAGLLIQPAVFFPG